ncbi:F-box/FBD/LRR-repeat protein At1g13570 isoform X1 [Nicotiana tabacum]|uniref:F-box/FBD/LRR-repeat protein At1g13570 isoform X1 n=1 Tax=Nicotiana tabacum TaxID=4097 RepID=A0A1S3XE86_TOBAC|nr:PREDICTED: F-box/FBD/LRR-repeat protein At1g13570-like isoform X1 [Nicotiana tabacum]
MMPPPDVLSNLPKIVIDEILMRLSLRDAVRTSILSKKWRYNWCTLPQLKLDQTLWKTTKDLTCFTSNFTKIIYHILTLHEGPITQFTLSIPYLEGCPNFDNLIYFLSRNGIQHLVLEHQSGNLYKLPSSFFTCSQLRHLSLENCIIRPPHVFKGFERLISLKLSGVTISSELLGSLISHSLFLENLVLENSDISNPVEISAPKLRSFVFIGDIHFIRLKYVPLLSKVSYEPRAFSVEAEHDLAKIFESIPALEHLCWNLHDVKAVDAGPVEFIPTRLPSSFNCLKRLYVSWVCLGEFFDLSFALCLIRSSPYLEEIEIEACDTVGGEYYEPVPCGGVDEIPASFSDMTFNLLRTVKLKGVTGKGSEMQLIKVLLAKSPALLRMVIDPSVEEDKKSLKVLAEITKFQRASSKAEVVYNVD